MRQSDNYELNLVEGTDLVNPLIQDVPNYEKIDEVMKANENASVGKAVELVSATVHAITRTWGDTPVFRFTATANYTAGETFTVDGIQVTALLPSGEALGTGAYITGAEVLCSLNSATNLMTVYTSGGTATLAQDSEKLGGNAPSYYATATAVEAAQSTANAAGVVAQAAQSAVTELEAKVGTYAAEETIVGTWINGKPIYRRVYAANNVSLTGNTIIDPSLNPTYVDDVISLSTEVKNSNIAWSSDIDATVPGGSRYVVKSNIIPDGIRLEILNLTIIAYCIIVEYTKP